MSVLVIGKSPEVLEKVKAGLRAKGIVAHGTTEIEQASINFDAKDFALVAFGGGVPTPVRGMTRPTSRRAWLGLGSKTERSTCGSKPRI